MIIGFVLVAFAVLAFGRRRNPPGSDRSVPTAISLEDTLRRAVSAGVISEEQAAAIVAQERGRVASAGGARRAASVSPALESFGYLGAVLVLVGGISLIARSWDSYETSIRVAILGVTTLALTGAGLAIRDEEETVLWRLRGVVLLFASGALGGFGAVLAVDVFDMRNERVGLLIGSIVAVHGGLLWWRKERPAQQLACLSGLVIALTSMVIWVGGRSGAVGIVLWILGAAWVAAAWRGLSPPREVGLGLGAVLVLVAAGLTMGASVHGGSAFALATAGALIGIGVSLDEFAITLAGVVGVIGYLPTAVAIYFGSAAGAPGVLLVSGLVLLALMVQLIRRRERRV